MLRPSKAKGDQFRASMRSLIGSLLRDTAGNTLGIVLATMILLVSLAGSGTDMARAYMTKTSLQNACDAGVLAGRKAMATSGTYGTSETAKANKMFNFNFNPNATNANSITFSTSSTGTGAVTGTASTVMPTVVMGIFGFKTITLTVACSAELQMASADVMFVLDTTGSMACDPNGTDCDSDSTSKIAGLRQAIRDFYKTVANAVVDKTNTRIRFGFVPYTATVNMGGLVAAGQMPTSYFADNQPFQTALANFNTAVYVPTAGSPVADTETYGSNITSANCTNWGKNTWPTNIGSPVSGGGPAPANTTSTTYSWRSWTLVSGSGSSALGTCVRNRTVTTTTYVTRYQFTNWVFQAATVNVSAFKGMGTVPVVTNIAANATVPTAGTYDMPSLAALDGTPGVTGLTITNSRWNGCIEERQTVQNLGMNPVPSGAKDLDIDSAPSTSDPTTQWKLNEEDLEWYRGSTNVSSRTETTLRSDTYRIGSQCPPRAMLFTDVDTTAPTVVPTWLDNYVNTLVAAGSTYHDIGMIWGARLASPSGIFASNVTAESTKYPSVSRHIIFMTDGEMAPTTTAYSAYGLELYDNRVAPSGSGNSTLTSYHNNRFLAACTRAKNLGYTVWVIGFGTALTTQMTTCATAGRAYFASNTTALNNTFKFIAGQVADLRINK
ncbi:Tad domain-containing protein [Novosphingobium sp.]|uniref:TadE/TadG family type IV pilus assembly protein n=1 Tax=Novosphingobium sp. TaxID=1874826 RepID=UPI0026202303|nr:Tad domain-containing protein [Novosphingobium sp.]